MKPARILLLLVAIIAGGLAAFLATRGGAPAPKTVVAVKTSPDAEVLVAKADIGVGQRLSPSVVEWQAWPKDAVRSEYLTKSMSPDASEKVSGAVARFEFFPGEPIREAKLARSDQGYLSAVLDPGMRGVSIEVNPASGSGGFIVPNDRVDVVVTGDSQAGSGSRTILNDVKVLAIGTRLGQTGTTGAPTDPSNPKSQVFITQTIATLELNPGNAETLINATAKGKISLVLRSVADFGTTASASGQGDSHAVNIIRFGKAASVSAGSSEAVNPDITPAAFTPAPFVPDTTLPTISAPAEAADAPPPPPVPQFQ